MRLFSQKIQKLGEKTESFYKGKDWAVEKSLSCNLFLCKIKKQLAFLQRHDIIYQQSFLRPLYGVAEIEGCDGHIHENMAPISHYQK